MTMIASGVRRALAVIGVQNLGLLAALVILATVIGSQNPAFFQLVNLRTIGTAVAILGIVAIGQTLVMIIGGLDISVGSQAGVASLATAMVFASTSSPALGIGAALAGGVLAGLINATIIVYGRVNAVIVTLATYAAFRGFANVISDGRAQGYTGGDGVFNWLARGQIFGFPVLIAIFMVVAVLAHVLLRHTDIGRNMYAVGGNATAARLAGINLNRYVYGAYISMGVLAAVAGILLAARTGSGQPTSGSQGLELQAITAAALGGAALQGGKGTILGTVLAVLLLGVLTNGLQILGVNTFYQDIAQGTLLVAAVVLQQRRKGVRAVGLPK